jgi:ribonuclease D
MSPFFMENNYLFIDAEETLAALCRDLHDSEWLAVDTEFEREKTYYPELCLLQIATPRITAIIDPISILNLDSVFELLYKKSIVKVFHSARQDLEIFFHLKGSVPEPVFDTQIAAALAGYESGIGYANLVEKMLGVRLNKSYTRTRWKQRPLHPEHLRYAADDVIYLGDVYQQLMYKLADPAHEVTLTQSFSRLSNPSLYLPDPETMWTKIKESRKFAGRNLLVLQKLAAWREIMARTENLPRKWLLSDTAIIEMARLLPSTEDEMTKIKGLGADSVDKFSLSFLKIIHNTV